MDPLAADLSDHLLPKLPQANPLERELWVRLDHAGHVADRGVGVEAEEQVRRGEVEQVERVRLNELPHVHQLANQPGWPGQLLAHDRVTRLGRGQVVADRADPADPLCDLGHLEEHAPLAELLEAPELVDVHPGLGDLARVIEMDRHLGVALDARDRFDGDGACHPLPSRDGARGGDGR